MPVITHSVPPDGVTSLAAELAALTALVAKLYEVGDTAEIRLFQDGLVAVTEVTATADYDAAECDFGGYAPIALPVAAPDIYQNDDGHYAVTLPSVQFNASGVAPSNMVGGWYLVDADGVTQRAAAFADAVEMATALDSLILSITIHGTQTPG